jgi:hypothetical protein
MIYKITEFLDFVHCPGILKNKTFLKLDLLPSSCERAGASHSPTWGQKLMQFPKRGVFKIPDDG